MLLIGGPYYVPQKSLSLFHLVHSQQVYSSSHHFPGRRMLTCSPILGGLTLGLNLDFLSFQTHLLAPQKSGFFQRLGRWVSIPTVVTLAFTVPFLTLKSCLPVYTQASPSYKRLPGASSNLQSARF